MVWIPLLATLRTALIGICWLGFRARMGEGRMWGERGGKEGKEKGKEKGKAKFR